MPDESAPPERARAHTPLVTVVLPTFNRARLLRRALESMVNQTLEDWECIVVDDASTDETRTVVEGLRESRIHYVRREVNGGAAAARNSGISLASGKFVAFLDSDDEYLPGKLERQIVFLEQDCPPATGGVLCAFTVAGHPDPLFVAGRRSGPLDESDLILFKGMQSTLPLVVKRTSLGDLRFDETLPAWEDWDLLLNLLRRCPLVSMPEPLVLVHRHAGPHLSGSDVYVEGLRRLVAKHEPTLPDRNVRALWHFKLALLLLKRENEPKEARTELVRSLRLWPFLVQRWLLLGMLQRRTRPPRDIYERYERLARLRDVLRRRLSPDVAARW